MGISRQSRMLTSGITRIGNSHVGYLYNRKISPDGIVYFQATDNAPVEFKGVLHVSDEVELNAEMSSTRSKVTLDTGLDLESLFGDNLNMSLIVEGIIFGQQNDYNKKGDIYHYIGEVIPATYQNFILPLNTTPPLINFNSLPLFLGLETVFGVSIWQGIPIYAGYSTLANAIPPYIFVQIVESGAYQQPWLDKSGKLDNWLCDTVILGFMSVPADQVQTILYGLYQNAQNAIPPVVNSPFVATTLENLPNSMIDLSINKQYYITKVNYHLSQVNQAFVKLLEANINWSVS